MNEIKNAQGRTAAKLCYAHIHLDELRNYPRKGSGDDFERSHQESFLYHVFGARDAFLQELNLYYNCGLDLHQVSVHRLKEKLKSKGVNSAELDELVTLENNGQSWLHNVKEMRDHSTHRHSVPLVFHVGGPEDGQVHFKHPRTGRTVQQDYTLVFETWCHEMEQLLERLRQSAVAAYQSNKVAQERPPPSLSAP